MILLQHLTQYPQDEGKVIEAEGLPRFDQQQVNV